MQKSHALNSISFAYQQYHHYIKTFQVQWNGTELEVSPH